MKLKRRYRWDDFTPKSYILEVIVDGGDAFFFAGLRLRPLDVDAASFREGVSSGRRYTYRTGVVMAVSRAGESEAEFILRCTAAGMSPDFRIERQLALSAEDENRDIVDLATGESLMRARADAIKRRREARKRQDTPAGRRDIIEKS